MRSIAFSPSGWLLWDKRSHGEKSSFCLKPTPRGFRAGTEVSQDAAWKEEVRENKGLVLSIDGIQPDRGNETIYLVRDVFTGRIVTAENVTERTKERLKEVLAPVVALGLPVVGVISDAQSTQLQAVAELWPGIAHQICRFHARSFAGRLIFVLDQRTKTEMRVRLQQKTHEYRQNIHKRMQAARAPKKASEEELAQLAVLEEYAAMVEAALNVESLAPFDYGGLAMQEALTHIQTSLERLEKRGSSEPNVREATQAAADHREFAGGEERSAFAHQSHA